MHNVLLPHALPGALDGRDGTKLLSLDCFDTLLWRDTHAPRDIFALLPGCTPQQRIWAESRARRAAMVRHRRNEVTIAEIYAELAPNASEEARAALIQAELDAEARHCFAFAPAVALIREAKRRRMQVVIVSDTYLTAPQLKHLIARAAGDEVANMIDRFFCSCEHGKSKGEGLLGVMQNAVRIKPERILHIGDNRNADLVSAERLGIPALHLLQFAEATQQRLRLEAATGAMVHAGMGTAFQPHRPTLAAGEPAIADTAEALGYGVLGPILQPFARWIADEAQSLASRRGRVRCLFLMRDGYLPHRVFDALQADIPGHAIELSRFTAIAAGFSSEESVRRFVEAEIGNGAPAELLRQLLYTPGEIAALVATLPAERKAIAPLLAALLDPAAIARVVERSRAFAERLKNYLVREVAPEPGDTLMLVDLGYNGTVQNHADAVLAEMLGVHVAGRYLLLREQQVTGLDKRGFIEAPDYDADTLEAFAANVAVLEQLCTASQGSVVGYSDDGVPVRRGSGIKARQSATREAVQNGCLAYARDHGRSMLRVDDAAATATHRRAAVAALARLMFLPQPEELAVLAQFEHDVNLGADDLVALFDPQVAAEGLIERGLFYLKGAERMYLPAELRGHGLPLNLTLLAQRRFGMDLRYADFCDKGLDVPVLLADGQQVHQSSIRAYPTHDGWFIAAMPVGDGRFSVGVQFGRSYEWLQIRSARYVPVEYFMGEKPAPEDAVIDALPSLEGMVQAAPHLFLCNDANAFLMATPPATARGEPMVLTIAFRPLVEREPDPAPAPSPARADRADYAEGVRP